MFTTSFNILPLTRLTQVRAVFHAGQQHASPTDVARLTRGLTAGEEGAFREFHARYFDRLYRFLLVVARGQEDEAREALQETLVRVVHRARRFDDEEVFWSWLKVVARNTARDAGRKQQRYFALLKEFALRRRDDAPEQPTGGETHCTALLREALEALSNEDRHLIEGKYLRGSTVRELAVTSGLTEKAVESRLWRLRRELRERLLKGLNET